MSSILNGFFTATNQRLYQIFVQKTAKIDRCTYHKRAGAFGEGQQRLFWSSIAGGKRNNSVRPLGVILADYGVFGVLLTVYQSICPYQFGDAPGLGDTASRLMRRVSIEYL